MRKKLMWLSVALLVPGGLVCYAFIWLLNQCTHKNCSFPMKRRDGNDYVTCLDCSKTFEYDWVNMKMGKELPRNVNLGIVDSTARTARLVEPMVESESRI